MSQKHVCKKNIPFDGCKEERFSNFIFIAVVKLLFLIFILLLYTFISLLPKENFAEGRILISEALKPKAGKRKKKMNERF